MVETGRGANATTSPAITKRRGLKRGFIRLWNVRSSVFGIGHVYICPGILRTLPILQHAEHILCDVHTDGTAESVIVEGDISLLIHARNIAIVIRGVTDISATTVT